MSLAGAPGRFIRIDPERLTMKTQNQQILELLTERGDKGINSFERLNGGIYAAQLPRCINDLRKLGHNILVSQPLKDRSVNYYLDTTPSIYSTPQKEALDEQKNPNKGRVISYSDPVLGVKGEVQL